MSAPRQVEPAPVLPEEITTNLGLADKHCRKSLELSNQAADLDPEIAEAQKVLDALNVRHSKLGADSTRHRELAKGYHEMALDRCKKYGYGPMPVPFDELVEHLKQQVERISPVATGALDTQASPAVKLDPLTDASFRAVS